MFGEGKKRLFNKTDGDEIRYRVYRATLRLVAHHYRLHDGTDELDARRELSTALNLLAAV